MTEPTTPYPERPRYASLQDYLRVIRRRRRLILVVTLLFAAAALLVSLSRNKVYEASAQLQFQDPLQQFQLVGGRVALPQQGSAQRAAANAQLVTRPQVTRRVEEILSDTNLGPGQLQGGISTRVGVQTGLVELDARAGSPGLAANIANAYARAVRQAGDKAARNELARVEKVLHGEVKAAQRLNPLPIGRVASLQSTLSQVHAAKEVSQPVKIAEQARVPGAPVSPNHKRDLTLGIFLGLIFGLIAAFVRDSLDRRFHSAHEIQDQLGMPVLGRVSDTAFGHPGLAGNGKAMDEGDFEAFRVLRMNLGYLAKQKPLRSVLVTSGLPEEGKSTVSMSLASAVALTGQRVLLVECDLRRPSFSRRLGIARDPGLTDYLLGRATPQDILQTVDVTAPTSLNGAGASDARVQTATVVCITAGAPVSTAPELLVSERFRDFLDKASKVYDLIVVDASPLLAVSDPLELIPQVDGVLVCVRAQQTTHEQARAARAALEHLPDRPTGAVLTGIRRGDPDAYHYYYGD